MSWSWGSESGWARPGRLRAGSRAHGWASRCPLRGRPCPGNTRIFLAHVRSPPSSTIATLQRSPYFTWRRGRRRARAGIRHAPALCGAARGRPQARQLRRADELPPPRRRIRQNGRPCLTAHPGRTPLPVATSVRSRRQLRVRRTRRPCLRPCGHLGVGGGVAPGTLHRPRDCGNRLRSSVGKQDA